MYDNKQLDMLLEKQIKLENDTTVKTKEVEEEEEEEEVTEEITKEVEVNQSDKIYIMYCIDKKLTISDIEIWIDDLFHDTNTLSIQDTLFIITKDDINETLIKFIIHVWERDRIFIVTESIYRLQFNILESVHVPPHSVLSLKETNEICKKHNKKIPSQLKFPTVSRFDPPVKLNCIRPNQICYIDRSSKTAINSDYYRVCENKNRY
jgi:DNA-directed RNA polymerase subunit H (RpoH/RPB5)